MSRLRVAVFSPLPPSPTGVADYTSELLPHLARHLGPLDVYVEDAPTETPREEATHRVLPARLFEAEDAKSPYDAVLYHHGNNPHHGYIYRQSLKRRGLALLHDAVLHHFIATTTLPQGRFDVYAEELRYAEGETGELLAQTRARGLLAEWHQFLVPLVDRVLAHSEGVLVHSAYVERAVRHRFPQLPVRRALHHFSPPPPAIERLTRSEARQRVGAPEEAFLVGSFGFVTPSKRVEAALAGFAPFCRHHPEAHYVVVGKLQEFDRTVLSRHALENRVTLTGRVSLDEFLTWLQAVDVVVNLRYPSAGESSGTLVRALGAGKPTLVSHMPYAADHPASAVLPIPVGDGEVEALTAALERLRSEPGLARSMGAAARAHARVRCSLEGAARAQADFIQEAVARRRRTGAS